MKRVFWVLVLSTLFVLIPAGDSDAATRRKKPKGPTIKSFTLIDAISKRAIKGYNPIPEGALINLSSLPTKYLNIRANVDSKTTKSVKFTANSSKAINATKAPFRIMSSKRGAAPNWNPILGANTVKAVPYATKNARGKKGKAKILQFTVEDEIIIDSTAPAIPRLAEWEANMLTYGAKHCDQNTINSLQLFEGGVWYFDGIRVYEQIADYTNNAAWRTCAGYVENVYRSYVLSNLTQKDGNIPGYRVFPHGLYMDFVKSGDTQSRDAVKLLANHTGYAYTGGSPDYHFSRETAYIIQAFLYGEQLGVPLDADLRKAVGFALGHIDQWVNGSTDFTQPYLVGLTMEALIEYFERTRDSRILPAVKKAADWLWNTTWDPSRQSFYYIQCKPGSTNTECGETGRDAADLNLLIAPAFAWIYSRTGDQTYLQRGDQIWSGGIREDFLNFGKQFTQNYRWSFKYVLWRAGKKGQ